MRESQSAAHQIIQVFELISKHLPFRSSAAWKSHIESARGQNLDGQGEGIDLSARRNRCVVGKLLFQRQHCFLWP